MELKVNIPIKADQPAVAFCEKVNINILIIGNLDKWTTSFNCSRYRDAKRRKLANYKLHSGNAIFVKSKYRIQLLSYKAGSKS